MEPRNELVVEILRDKAAGKTKEMIFDDLVDNRKMNPLFVRTMLESLRW